MTPEHARNIIRQRERGFRRNEWNLSYYGTNHAHPGRRHVQLWDDSTLADVPCSPARAEELVWAKEVLREMVRRFGQARVTTFLCHAEYSYGLDPPTTRTERHHRQVIRREMRAWARRTRSL